MIYYVEDDVNIRDLLVYALKQTGYEAMGFPEGSAFEKAMAHGPLPDLILLDIMLPGQDDGLALLQKLKSHQRTMAIPVIILTARGAESDRVEGLDQGADDYVIKPFGVMELIARIKAVLRRSGVSQPAQTLTAGGVSLDHMKHTVTAEGKPVNLTLKEYELLRFLMEHPQTAFDRETLLKEVWSQDYFGGSRTVDVHIRTLRQKLGDCADRIETIRGLGYRFRGNTP